ITSPRSMSIEDMRYARRSGAGAVAVATESTGRAAAMAGIPTHQRLVSTAWGSRGFVVRPRSTEGSEAAHQVLVLTVCCPAHPASSYPSRGTPTGKRFSVRRVLESTEQLLLAPTPM